MTLKLPVELRDEIRALPCWPHDYEIHDEDALELIVRRCAQEAYDEFADVPIHAERVKRRVLRDFGLDEKEGT